MDSKHPFKSWQVYKILRDTLENEAGFKKTYDPIAAAKRTLNLAKDIRLAIKALNYDRYKFCVKVDIGQKWDQGACSMARFMWDVEKDDFAYYTCENSYFFIIATVFAFYFD
ncbi:Uncharacterized protein GBIM_07437 [Gryllus bimaculatus]|nr:Uncharacterized protein GBIM_07437 [Gryllus bimaculatus]